MNSRTRLITTATLIVTFGTGAIATLLQLQQHNSVLAAASAASMATVEMPMTSQVPPEVSPAEISLALYRCGLDPETLAAAGVASILVDDVVGDAEEYLSEHLSAIADADSAFGAAQQSVEDLRRLVQSGKGSQGDVTSFASAQTALSTAIEDRDNAIASFITAATASLEQSHKTALATIRANRSRDLPLQYLVVNRTDAQWVQLRDALANERISDLNDVGPDSGAQTLLQQVREDTAVLAATTSLASNAAANAAIFESALAQP